MAASRDDLRQWLDKGNTGEHSHMLVICDTFDWDDYPVYVKKGESVDLIIQQGCMMTNMQRLVEVYSYSLDLETQLRQERAFNY